MGSYRTARVGKEIRELLGSLLLFDVADPRLKDVQIISVDVSGDLKHADVYYVMVDPDSPAPSEGVRHALSGSASFLRKMLGDRMTMKFVPELRFKYDESIETGRRIEELLDGLDIRDSEE